MGELIYDAPPGLYSKWILSQGEAGYLERILHIIERLCHTQEPPGPEPAFVLLTLLNDLIHFSRARAHCEDRVIAENRIRRQNYYGLVHFWS